MWVPTWFHWLGQSLALLSLTSMCLSPAPLPAHSFWETLTLTSLFLYIGTALTSGHVPGPDTPDRTSSWHTHKSNPTLDWMTSSWDSAQLPFSEQQFCPVAGEEQSAVILTWWWIMMLICIVHQRINLFDVSQYYILILCVCACDVLPFVLLKW